MNTIKMSLSFEINYLTKTWDFQQTNEACTVPVAVSKCFFAQIGFMLKITHAFDWTPVIPPFIGYIHKGERWEFTLLKFKREPLFQRILHLRNNKTRSEWTDDEVTQVKNQIYFYTKLYSFRFSCRIVSLTAAKTNRMFSVSVAHVKCE